MFKKMSGCVPAATALGIEVYTDDRTADRLLKDLKRLRGVTSVDKIEHVWKPVRRYNITAGYWDFRRLGRQIGSVLGRYKNVQYLIGGVQHVHMGVEGVEDPGGAVAAMVALGPSAGIEEWLLSLPRSGKSFCYSGSRAVSKRAILKGPGLTPAIPIPDWLTLDTIESWGYIETQAIVSKKSFKESARKVYVFYKTLNAFD